MTMCTSGVHDFPVEDETGAYCEEHGVLLIRTGRHGTREVPRPVPLPTDPPTAVGDPFIAPAEG